MQQSVLNQLLLTLCSKSAWNSVQYNRLLLQKLLQKDVFTTVILSMLTILQGLVYKCALKYLKCMVNKVPISVSMIVSLIHLLMKQSTCVQMDVLMTTLLINLLGGVS